MADKGYFFADPDSFGYGGLVGKMKTDQKNLAECWANYCKLDRKYNKKNEVIPIRSSEDINKQLVFWWFGSNSNGNDNAGANSWITEFPDDTMTMFPELQNLRLR